MISVNCSASHGQSGSRRAESRIDRYQDEAALTD